MLNTHDLKKLSQDIREARENNHWTRAQLAAKLGTSARKIASYESYGAKDHQVPNTVMLNALNKVFGFDEEKPQGIFGRLMSLWKKK